MPSTAVHVGFAALLGVALLGDRFDARAVLVVMAAAALPDIDTVIGLWVTGAHRTMFHNLVFPALVLGVLLWDVHYRDESYVLDRWGPYGYRVAWVSIVGGWIVAQVLLDAFFNGTNLFWPLYDQFIDLSGQLYLSDRDGLVQTFVELERASNGEGVRIAAEHVRGTSQDFHYSTGVDPGPDYPPDVERRFPIANQGTLFVVMMTGYLATVYRLWEIRRGETNERA